MDVTLIAKMIFIVYWIVVGILLYRIYKLEDENKKLEKKLEIYKNENCIDN